MSTSCSKKATPDSETGTVSPGPSSSSTTQSQGQENRIENDLEERTSNSIKIPIKSNEHSDQRNINLSRHPPNPLEELLQESSISDLTNSNNFAEPLSENCDENVSVPENVDSFFIMPASCSHYEGSTRMNSESHSQNKKQASQFMDSSLRASSNESDNFDELAHLEVNKCNIADDSDDSESMKSLQSSFGKLNFDALKLSHSKMSNQPVNHSSTSVQSSNALNSSDFVNQEHNNKSNMSNSAFARSLQRSSNPIPIRNPCQLHRSSMSSHDLMNASSNYSLGHRSMLHSYNAQPHSHCCHNHYRHNHYYHREPSQIPVSFQRQHCQANQKNPFDLGMSSIDCSRIISSHCNTEQNTTNAQNSSAITTLTASSSSGLPVTALTVMEYPNLSTSNNGSYNWQTLMSTLKDRMATIFNSELLADVHFNVGKGEAKRRFPGHILVLSIGSAVFDKMFNGTLTKANMDFEKQYSSLPETVSRESEPPEIDLPDVEPDAFLSLLRYLYLDEIDIGPETVMTTLYVAKKYEVPGLELACVDFLKANLSSENAFMLLTQARLFDEPNLADLCLDTIDKHTMDSLYSECFFDIDLDTLKLVLKRDSLRVREVSLFIAAMRWAKCECVRQSLEATSENKRKVLGDALYLIRFPLMNIDEFALNVAQSELLTDREVVNLFLYFTVSFKPSLPFSLEPRCCITGEECSVNRFQRTESRWGYSGTSDRIRFLTDRPIFVIGFGLFGSIHGPSEYDVIIEILHTGSGKVLASNTTTFVSPENASPDSTYKVLFKHPVEIIQNTNYTACATLKGVDSYYGTNGYRTVTVNLGKGEAKDAVTFQFSYAAGCNNGTSVEDGQIPEIIFYT